MLQTEMLCKQHLPSLACEKFGVISTLPLSPATCGWTGRPARVQRQLTPVIGIRNIRAAVRATAFECPLGSHYRDCTKYFSAMRNLSGTVGLAHSEPFNIRFRLFYPESDTWLTFSFQVRCTHKQAVLMRTKNTTDVYLWNIRSRLSILPSLALSRSRSRSRYQYALVDNAVIYAV